MPEVGPVVESPEMPPQDRIVTEAEIIETLTGNGVPLDDYFLFDGRLPVSSTSLVSNWR